MIRTIKGIRCRSLKIGEKVEKGDVFNDGQAIQPVAFGVHEEHAPSSYLCAWRKIEPRAKLGANKKKSEEHKLEPFNAWVFVETGPRAVLITLSPSRRGAQKKGADLSLRGNAIQVRVAPIEKT